jgi:hypothetical protein
MAEVPVFAGNQLYSPWAGATSLFIEPGNWEAHRDSGIRPQFVSSLANSEAGRVEALEGFRLLRLNREKFELRPQQLVIADALGATKEDGTPAASFLSVLAPRRSSKTTSALAVALGRCSMRDEYRVAFTLATTRDLAAKRFKYDIAMVLERLYPNKAERPMQVRTGTGTESLVWANGSIFSVVTPNADGFRSEAFDMIIVDEAQAASVEATDDILAGALATMDTRPDSQFVILGTAGAFREGNLLWMGLEMGRQKLEDRGIVEYSVYDPDRMITAEELADWETVEPLALAAHPGLTSGLTPVSKVRGNFPLMKPATFLREYLSIFGMGGNKGGLFDLEAWALAGIATKAAPRPPEAFSMALAVHPDQTCASLVAAWRSRGKARVLVLENRPGVAWVADRAATLASRYSIPIVHDDKGVVNVQVSKMERMRPRPRLQKTGFRDVLEGVALFMAELDNANLQHYNQPELNEGIKATIKRAASGSTAFGRREQMDDITTVEAAAMALQAYDSRVVRAPLVRTVLTP